MTNRDIHPHSLLEQGQYSNIINFSDTIFSLFPFWFSAASHLLSSSASESQVTWLFRKILQPLQPPLRTCSEQNKNWTCGRSILFLLPSGLLWAAMSSLVTAIATAVLASVATTWRTTVAAGTWRTSVLRCAAVLIVLVVVIVLGTAIVALTAWRGGSSVPSCVLLAGAQSSL